MPPCGGAKKAEQRVHLRSAYAARRSTSEIGWMIKRFVSRDPNLD
jgi:hypothetical protein